MTDIYTKSSPDRFPDFCDQRVYGKHPVAGDFEVLTPNIVNNDMRWTNNLNGYKVPAWFRLVREGLNATSPLTGTLRTVQASKCFVEVSTTNTVGSPGNYRCTEWKGYPFYAIPTSDPPSDAVISDIRNAALAKFYANVAKDRNNSQYGETLGEWRETVRAIRSPMKGIVDFIKRYRKSSKKRLKWITERRRGRLRRFVGRDRDFRNEGRTARLLATSLADMRLEFKFGWEPLVKTTNEAVKAMLDRWDHPNRVITQGKAGSDYNGVASESTLFTHENYRVSQAVKTFSRYEHRFRACIWTGAVNGNIGVQQTLGLLPEDWFPTVYELFPWSFVLDYFLQVGDLINAVSFRRSSIIWGVEDKRTFTRKEYGVPIIRIDPNVGGYATYKPLKLNSWGGDCKTEIKSITRSDILQVSLLPDLYWHMPFNRGAWYNMASIFTSNFARP